MGVAIIVCDRAIIEAETNNKTLVLIFNNINAPLFPCRHDRLCVYVALTNGKGQKQISLGLKRHDASSDTSMHLFGGGHFENPNAVIEMIFNLRNVIFTEPGAFVFEVLADGEYVFESRFNVCLTKPQTPMR